MTVVSCCCNQELHDSINISDWISIANILVTSSIGIWIVTAVQKNFTINRSVKEYFISECQEIRKQYTEFLNCLFKESRSSKSSVEWFRLMTIKINNYEAFLKDEFNFEPRISKTHNEIKQYVTDVDEFNDCFNKPNLVLTPTTRRKILEMHKEFTKELTKNVIEINRASKRHYWFKSKNHKKNVDDL